jgi:hypothetical protein
VQFAEVVSALAQWAKLNAGIRLNALPFPTGAAMDTKFVPHLLLKKLL